MEYKVSELAEKTGVTKRTIHFYISKGLLLPPKGSGVNSVYSDEHVERILLIKKLQADYLPLNKIRDIINGKENYNKLEEQKIIEKIESDEYEQLRSRLKAKGKFNGDADFKKVDDEELCLAEECESNNNEREDLDSKTYIRENVCGIFEMHYTKENGKKYDYIIENVKKYVEKMLSE